MTATTTPSGTHQGTTAPFLLFLAALIVAPWPLGSNRDWAWPVLTILICLSTIGIFASNRWCLTTYLKMMLIGFSALILIICIQLWGIPGVSAPFTVSFFDTRSELLKSISLMAFAFSACQLLNTEQRIKFTIYGVLISAAALALLGGTQQLFFGTDRASGSFANANHFANYLAMAACLAIGLMLATARSQTQAGTSTWQQFLIGEIPRLRMIIVILVIALVMSRSRMGNLAFLSGILTAFILNWYFTRRVNRTNLVLLASILVFDILVLGSYFGIDRLQQRFQQATTQATMRVELQHYNLKILSANPLIGVGAGAYETAFTAYRDEHVPKRASHAETDYLEFLVELGIIGSLALCCILAAGLIAMMQLLKHGDSFQQQIALGCFAGTVTLLIHSVAEIPLQIPANSLLFVLLLTMPIASLAHLQPPVKEDKQT